MKTNPNEPINAVLTQSPFLQNENTLGLTKREHMIIEFTKALLGRGEHGYSDSEGNALSAIHQADTLINILNKEV